MSHKIIYDIKFYNTQKDGRSGFEVISPRRINENGYHVEWNRKGVLFMKCPIGVIRNEGHKAEDIQIKSGIMVPWDRMIKQEAVNNGIREEFHIIPHDGIPLYNFRVIDRKPLIWLEWNTKVPNNYNREVLLQIASIFEESHGIVKEIKNYQGRVKELLTIKECFNQNHFLTNSYQEDKVLYILQRLLPKGIDDTLCNLIIKTWKLRLKERAINDLFSNDEKHVANAIGFLKNNTM